MDGYLDTSVLLSFFIEDVNSQRAEQLLGQQDLILYVSDWAILEFSNVLARRVRTQEMAAPDASSLAVDLDHWLQATVTLIEASPTDFASATAFLRRWTLSLRSADAVHIALAQRLGLTLMTFDNGMA